MEFLASIALFLAAMRGSWRRVAPSARTHTPTQHRHLALAIEIVCIAFHASRGTTSHFNYSTFFNGALLQIIGLSTTVNTVATVVMLDPATRHTGWSRRLTYGRPAGPPAICDRQPAWIRNRRQPGTQRAGV